MNYYKLNFPQTFKANILYRYRDNIFKKCRPIFEIFIDIWNFRIFSYRFFEVLIKIYIC